MHFGSLKVPSSGEDDRVECRKVGRECAKVDSESQNLMLSGDLSFERIENGKDKLVEM